MSGRFTDKVVIVTGASRGIGRATAVAFAAEGAQVIAASRFTGTVDLPDGERLFRIVTDVADASSIEKMFDQVEARFGGCDVLINNAGYATKRRVLDMTAAQWDHEFAINMRAAFVASRRAVPLMSRRGGGAIVNVASISGISGPQKFPGLCAYVASKAALIAFTEAFAVEAKPLNVRVNCVSPGSVDTEMLRNAAPGVVPDMTPEEVAKTILFLASDESRPINGQNIHVYSS